MDNATVIEALKAKFGDAIQHTLEYRGAPIVWVAPERLVEVATWLRDEPQFAYIFLSDVSGLDCLTMQAESLPSGRDPAARFDSLRFVVNYQLLSHANKHRLWLKVGLPADHPTVASVVGVWPTADFLEREIYDLMGITFSGHPNLKRILMPDDWEGYPLRKDAREYHEDVQFTHNFDRIERQKKYATR